ncbi:hypothetical protein MOJ79_02675 [Calidifontimicrobium sp. SYSU G02091]|uniref:hypothetical protein n=1 Tax=Calidifontimicrobium sp. SYSU G02091 TaxID=2926421 RepID=UPI001F5377EA|nr:hypothetical protein [Calidifontimicrobium sp. SYSU G02091]MCI1190741.1 hypothetical protein [Calidifontimicrobium sp. SYSU G02091]
MERRPLAPPRPALTPPRAALRPGTAGARHAATPAARTPVLAVARAPQQLSLFPPRRG